MSTILDDIYNAVINCEAETVEELVNQAVQEKIDPLVIFEKLNSAIKSVGDKFGEGEIFITELVAAAEAMKAGVNIVEPMILASKRETKTFGKIAMATAEGDIHDIGKNIVVVMLRAAGFNVNDLGVDVPVEKIIEVIKKSNPQVVGISALLTSTVSAQEKLIKQLHKEGIRDKVKVILGGAPVTQEWTDKIGADGFAADGPSAVTLVKQLLKIQ